MDVELLDAAIDWTGQRIAAVQPEWHAELPTPCAEWTVRQLLNHQLGVMDTITDIVAGQPWPDGVDANTLADIDRVGDDPMAAFAACAARARTQWNSPSEPERRLAVPGGGQAPVAWLIRAGGLDMVVHGWDLARATGENVDIPADLARRLLSIAHELVHDGLRGTANAPYAYEVIIDAGSDSDRLMAFLGRTP